MKEKEEKFSGLFPLLYSSIFQVSQTPVDPCAPTSSTELTVCVHVYIKICVLIIALNDVRNIPVAKDNVVLALERATCVKGQFELGGVCSRHGHLRDEPERRSANL